MAVREHGLLALDLILIDIPVAEGRDLAQGGGQENRTIRLFRLFPRGVPRQDAADCIRQRGRVSR